MVCLRAAKREDSKIPITKKKKKTTSDYVRRWMLTYC